MKGFTLVEVLIVLVILVLVTGVIYAGYVLSQRAYIQGEISAELTQNARVVLERMTREIRQAREVVTDLPSSAEEALNHIEFEDGHGSDRYYYIRYFQADNELKREMVAYYFSGDDTVFVPRNAIPPPGESLEEALIEEARTIGEFVKELKVWSPETKIINIFINLEKGGKELDFSTSVSGRNL